MSFLKKLFGGGAGNDNGAAKAGASVEHEGYLITPAPQKEGGQFRLAGTISMEIDGETMKLSGKLVFDRQKYDVAWAHYVQDVILNDDIVRPRSAITRILHDGDDDEGGMLVAANVVVLFRFVVVVGFESVVVSI